VIQLNIDWQGLYTAFQTNAAEFRCFFCTDTGAVLRLPPGDPDHEKVRDSPGKYRSIEVVPSRIQYQWVSEFVKSIEHESIKSRMEAAINGKGAFRRFKDILLTLPDERRRWFEYRDRRMRVRVVEWIEENSIEPLNEPVWSEEGADQTPSGEEPSDRMIAEVISAWARSEEVSLAITENQTLELSKIIKDAFSLTAK
jgi:hypothetical protein